MASQDLESPMRCSSGSEGLENDEYGLTGWKLHQKMNVVFERAM